MRSLPQEKPLYSVIMFSSILVALFAVRILALPAVPDDATFALYNQSAPFDDASQTCYPKTDPVFFSLMSASKYNSENCYKAVIAFTASFKQFGDNEEINFWYTGNQVPPKNLKQPAMQLPVFHKSDKCSLAMVSPKLLNDFANQREIPWRPEWGSKYDTSDITTATRLQFLSNGGFLSAIECSHKGGKAAYQQPNGGWKFLTHAFPSQATQQSFANGIYVNCVRQCLTTSFCLAGRIYDIRAYLRRSRRDLVVI